MLRTPENAELIREIDGGIKKEVSVGCRMGACRCSVCGLPRGDAGCHHEPGKFYGGRMCCGMLSEPLDAYEWSFVAVPAQREAGVIKSCGAADRAVRHAADALARAQRDRDSRRAEDRRRVARLMALLLPELDTAVAVTCSEDLRDESLDDVRKALETRAEQSGLFSPLTITRTAAVKDANDSFRI